jgi:hypothetical protein
VLVAGAAEVSGVIVLALDEVEGVVVVVVVVVEPVADCVLVPACPAEAAADGVGSVEALGFEAVLELLGVVLAAPAAAVEGSLLVGAVLALLVWSGVVLVLGAAADVALVSPVAAPVLELVLWHLSEIIFTLSTLRVLAVLSAVPVICTVWPTCGFRSCVLPERVQDLPD